MYFDFTSEKDKNSVLIFPDEKEVQLFQEAGKEPPRMMVSTIELDKNGNQCFKLPNWRSPKHATLNLFSEHIKDAVEEIRIGYGDRIETGELFQSIFQTRPTRFSVYRYIDRSIGDAIKSESIKGWKNTKFGYSIIMYNPNSFNSPKFITRNFDFWYGTDLHKVLTFDTIDEAENVVKDIVEKATRFGDWVKTIEFDPNFSKEEYDREASKYPNIIRYGSTSGYIIDDGRKYFGRDKKIDDYYIIQIIQDVKVD